MIPKVIHYCWFGGNPLPEKDRKCIESWKKYCPDYEIREWNEKNYDISKNKYMLEAYKNKKWGFVPDYARFDIIFNEGGFYLDTDVELIKSLDELRDNEAYMGFECDCFVNGGIGFGAHPQNNMIKNIRDMYNNLSFYKEDGELNLKPSPHYITEFLEKNGLERNNKLQNINGLIIYPIEYFAPKDYYTGVINCTNNTISIHHYNMSWVDPRQKKIHENEQKLTKVLGARFARVIMRFYSLPYRISQKIKNRGFIGTLKFSINKIFNKK